METTDSRGRLLHESDQRAARQVHSFPREDPLPPYRGRCRRTLGAMSPSGRMPKDIFGSRDPAQILRLTCAWAQDDNPGNPESRLIPLRTPSIVYAMPEKPKDAGKEGPGDKDQEALVQKKTQLLKTATLRDEDVTVIEIRVRSPRSGLLRARGVLQGDGGHEV